MSTKMIQTPTATVVCDLCGKQIDTYSHRDHAALNWGTTPLARMAEPKPKRFLFFRRGHGVRQSGAPEGDFRSWQWDFHGECLVALVEQNLFDRKPQDLKPGVSTTGVES